MNPSLSTEINRGQIQTKKSVCFWCKGECGVLVKVTDGNLLGYEKDPDFPREVFPSFSGCPRARRAKEYIYHPDRLRFPLKRTGERGEGKWRRVSWNQALDEIAERLLTIKEQYGAEALMGAHGTQRTHTEYMRRFFNLFGSPNIGGQGTICAMPRKQISNAICGNYPFYAISSKTRCIVLIGLEPNPARPATFEKLRQARKTGAKLLVIDPRRTYCASQADVWLQIRPGTDPALLLGMINMIIREDLYDHEFVDKWCHGFDKVVERAKEYPIEKVSQITSIPAEKIKEAVMLYTGNKPASISEGMGIEQARNTAASLHARWILAAITGNIDIEGGEEMFAHHLPGLISHTEIVMPQALPKAQRMKQLGNQFKIFSYDGQENIQKVMTKAWGKTKGKHSVEGHLPIMWRAIIDGEPYPVKAVIVTGANPMVTQANTKMVYKAFKSSNLDLSVVMDFFMTPTAALADFVLPAACWLERPGITFPHSDQRHMTAGVAALPHIWPGKYDYRRDFDFYRGLGMRLGQEEFWPWESLEASYDERVKPAGYNGLEELVEKVRCYVPEPVFKKYEQTGFGTPTGKVELYSTIFEAMGYDPLPRYVEPHETIVSAPEVAAEYPLTLLTGGRTIRYYHSEWRQVWSIRDEYPYPLIQLHPEIADSLGIVEADWVWIENERGKIKARATIFDGMEPNIVHVEHGWWLPELPAEEPWICGVWDVNCNVLGDDNPQHCDPVTGGWGLKTILCRIYKAKQF